MSTDHSQHIGGSDPYCTRCVQLAASIGYRVERGPTGGRTFSKLAPPPPKRAEVPRATPAPAQVAAPTLEERLTWPAALTRSLDKVEFEILKCAGDPVKRKQLESQRTDASGKPAPLNPRLVDYLQAFDEHQLVKDRAASEKLAATVPRGDAPMVEIQAFLRKLGAGSGVNVDMVEPTMQERIDSANAQQADFDRQRIEAQLLEAELTTARRAAAKAGHRFNEDDYKRRTKEATARASLARKAAAARRSGRVLDSSKLPADERTAAQAHFRLTGQRL